MIKKAEVQSSSGGGIPLIQTRLKYMPDGYRIHPKLITKIHMLFRLRSS
jgi:hypothetical protein